MRTSSPVLKKARAAAFTRWMARATELPNGYVAVPSQWMAVQREIGERRFPRVWAQLLKYDREGAIDTPRDAEAIDEWLQAISNEHPNW